MKGDVFLKSFENDERRTCILQLMWLRAHQQRATICDVGAHSIPDGNWSEKCLL